MKDAAAIMMPDDKRYKYANRIRNSQIFCRKNHGDCMWKTTAASFFLCGDTLFLKPVLRQREVMLNERSRLCFWQSFCAVGCYRYTINFLLPILPIQHKMTPSHMCKNAAG